MDNPMDFLNQQEESRKVIRYHLLYSSISAEALSRALNSLHQNLYFCGFGLPKWSPKINHLSYAYDTIIFSSSDATSLKLIVEVLRANETASGQLINKAKSAVYLHHLTNVDITDKVQRITGINRQEFPFRYLGCPIFYARRKMEYYHDLMKKVLDKIQSWQGKLLLIGGRVVLINHVLQRMPIHLLSAVNPPASVINKLYKMIAQFFWSNSIGGKARHWASWDSLCLPKEEGGPGFRSLHDMSRALFLLEGTWNETRLMQILPHDIASHIIANIKRSALSDELDKPFWMMEPKGYFTVKSAWDYVRRRRDQNAVFTNIWVKGLPFKIAFFMWKVWKRRIPLDDFFKWLGYYPQDVGAVENQPRKLCHKCFSNPLQHI
ncbi:uncharacterized protein LOC142165846 [Nicotiana tabacum]|uniref:Uncharacterized protein LOC142165846 n=1 Tax=Nicotiana tabacum TaxID=4097 RepID=A0AC58S5R7_TOBAC